MIEYVPEKQLRFPAHSGLEVVAVEHQKFRGRWHGADIVEVQPATHKVPNKPLGPGVRQHAFDLCGQIGPQFAGSGQLEECGVWRRGPEEIRESRRQRHFAQLPIAKIEIQEAGRAENRLTPELKGLQRLHAFLEFGCHELLDRLQLAGQRWTAKRFLSKDFQPAGNSGGVELLRLQIAV